MYSLNGCSPFGRTFIDRNLLCRKTTGRNPLIKAILGIVNLIVLDVGIGKKGGVCESGSKSSDVDGTISDGGTNHATNKKGVITKGQKLVEHLSK